MNSFLTHSHQPLVYSSHELDLEPKDYALQQLNGSQNGSIKKHKTNLIFVNNEREAELRQCRKEFHVEGGESQLWDNKDDKDFQVCICQHTYR